MLLMFLHCPVCSVMHILYFDIPRKLNSSFRLYFLFVQMSGKSIFDTLIFLFEMNVTARIIEWGAFPFSKGSFQHRIRTGVSCTEGDSLPTELSGKPIQFSSVAQLCLTLCDPKNCSMPGLPVHHQLPEFTQTHVSEWL